MVCHLKDSAIASMKGFHEQPTEIKAQVYRNDIGMGVSYMSNVDLYHSKATSLRQTKTSKLHFPINWHRHLIL